MLPSIECRLSQCHRLGRVQSQTKRPSAIKVVSWQSPQNHHQKSKKTSEKLAPSLSLRANVIVGGRISSPTATSEPRVPISRHVAPQYTSLCHRHPIVDDYSFTGLGTCSLELDSVSGFRYAIDHRVRLKPRPFPSPYAISCTGPTSAYPGYYPRHWLLRASYSAKAYGLVACSSFT